MQKQYRFIVSALLLGAFLLSACSGALPGQDDSPQGTAGTQATEVVFTGTVQSMGGGQWQISGQPVGVDGFTSVDPKVKVGDIVRVEARVFQDGSVLALKVESSLPDDTANSNGSNSNDIAANSNDIAVNSNDASNANANTNDNANTNANTNDDNSNSAPSGTEQEFSGVVEAITTNSITINGVTYQLANFTEFKDIIAVGDQVKIHVIVNADGTFTIREIERSLDDDDNSNSNTNINSNSNTNSNVNSNSNSNSNDNDDDDNDNDDNDNDNDD